MNNLNSIWEKSLELIKPEITEVSFNTWLLPIKPLSINEDTLTITLSIFNTFSKGILEQRYSSLISNAIKHLTGCDYKLVFTTNEVSTQESSEVPKKPLRQTAISLDDMNLNPKYIFDTFVIGNSNRFAHAASLAVAESPAKAYNPLFIYGGVGLGKTHLMHAIGHYVLKQKPDTKVLYVSSEKFTNELINAIKDDKNVEFRNKFRNIDILLIDDIQFIAGKERTQEEFFHTFNTLHDANKQIILSSDRPPKEIPTLEERLRSRFEWGLIADIQAPDYETRVAILRKKADLEDLDVSNDVMQFVAEKIQSNIRELEGALIRVVAYASLTNREISIELANEALKDVFSSSRSKAITVKDIKELISKYFNISLVDLDSKKRTRNISNPRQIAMYLTRELTDLSLPKIGQEFGGRDHTTVIHAYEKISSSILTNPNLKETIEKLMKDLK